MFGYKIIKENELNDLIAESMDFERQLIRTKEVLNRVELNNVKLKKDYDKLTKALSTSLKTIEELKNENEELRKGQAALLSAKPKRKYNKKLAEEQKVDTPQPKKRGRKKKEEKDAL